MTIDGIAIFGNYSKNEFQIGRDFLTNSSISSRNLYQERRWERNVCLRTQQLMWIKMVRCGERYGKQCIRRIKNIGKILAKLECKWVKGLLRWVHIDEDEVHIGAPSSASKATNDATATHVESVSRRAFVNRLRVIDEQQSKDEFPSRADAFKHRCTLLNREYGRNRASCGWLANSEWK